ncbi:phosphoribosylanthranilate isomerase [Aequitasia blattaphilus]|uniref:N-(5'-phosphoribosyl)anthranilate isomerase n=1 Tax=Aequitasia blattaphilus TaxID=2949332 RepID=A0ABT1E6Y2_9FIRM|nr:phosphoribosylanthranilate isomerase [Aequitasia blattaphilus]MCP1101579.1 phosphoribosylanthranilate isomerase [Aequitasia blattaphilus]MCR8614219.1 phosphoribosylanthranilate isomerase [Aequitasia blattaphilus]
MTKIKVCGIKRLEDVEYLNELMPDYAGFVFAQSSRQISKEEGSFLRSRLDGMIPVVGVFVNENPEVVLDCVEQGIVQMIQLHGEEGNNYIDFLRRYSAVPIIKSISITKKEDMDSVRDSTADYVLLDNRSPGSGKKFNWDLVEKIERPFFLAGGISIDNVEESIHRFKPYGVDSSSSLETDGVKDKKKIKEFIRRIKNVER